MQLLCLITISLLELGSLGVLTVDGTAEGARWRRSGGGGGGGGGGRSTAAHRPPPTAHTRLLNALGRARQELTLSTVRRRAPARER